MNHYKRSALLALARSPLAATCIENRRLAKFTSLLTANHSPSSAELGVGIKGSPSANVSSHPFPKDRLPDLRETPSTAISTARWSNIHKPNSYSTIQFNREDYAAKYSTPFTPDPSLMKPADLTVWTPTLATPLITPNHNGNGQQIRNRADPDYASMNCNWSQKQEKKETSTPNLRPSAQVFIPSCAPLLMSNPQPKRRSTASSLQPNHVNMKKGNADVDKAAMREYTSVQAHANSLASHFVPFGAPKALTPLARPSAALPARPAACAVEPNLPRWAHSPGHGILASLDSRHKTFADLNSKDSLIRPVSPSKIKETDYSETHRSHGVKTKYVNITARDMDESADEDGDSMSCVSKRSQSASMTPWAKQKTHELSASLMTTEKLVKDLRATNIECGFGVQSPITTKISLGEVQSPLSHPSISMSGRMPSSAVKVGNMGGVKAAASFDGNTWRRQIQSSWASPREPRKPNLTPSVPGGRLGAVPMHSVNIK
ncbi:hypothetical protein QFC19_004199 [Naganishia cerealis]|uniref:Uncharacterized protein n=1 Tax=Naganishia cerealis TaxID=610337 RepID=A0ACC2VX16_9TREE|nr:hypothetical protein QFC19_004199 [Naganishia cerealis]